MRVSSPFTAEGRDAPAFLTRALLDEMVCVFDLVLIYLPGGRIAAVNRAAARLSDVPVVGMFIHDLLTRNEARRADSSEIIPTISLSCARALRREGAAL